MATPRSADLWRAGGRSPPSPNQSELDDYELLQNRFAVHALSSISKGTFMNHCRSSYSHCVSVILYLCLFLCLLQIDVRAQIPNNWQPTFSQSGGWISNLGVSPGGKIFAAVSDLFANTGAIYTSSDNGIHWAIMQGLPNVVMELAAVDPSGRIFVGTETSGIYRSDDNGRSWALKNSGIGTLGVRAFLFGPTGQILSGALGVYRSTDNGDSWSPMPGIGNSVLSFAPDQNNVIYAGATLGVYRSTDGGANWSKMPTVTNAQSVVVLSNSSVLAAGSGGVFKSTNQGNTWSNVGLSKYLVFSLVKNGEGHIFAGVYQNVFRSTDNGASWSQFGDIIPSDYVQALAISPDGHLVAGTVGGSIFRSSGVVTWADRSELETAGAFSLVQNYPNPFNPSTIISYSLPKTASVSLRIFNALGQEVAMLVNEQKPPGYYQVQWNANVPSGVYFYRLQAGEFVETKKMMLIK